VKRYIYVATPWGPVGGGMYKVADYLIQAQDHVNGSAELHGLDTRGNGSAFLSFAYLVKSLWKILIGHISGNLAGVHINMAERLSVLRKGLILVFCRLLGIPTLLHLHAAQFPQFYHALPVLFRSVIRQLFNMPEVCIVLGESAKQFIHHELLVPLDRIEIVINGVPPPIIARRKIDKAERQQILFLGNLSERKGVSDLLNAIAIAKLNPDDVSVNLAGGGDIEKYKILAATLGLNSLVCFKGWADQQIASALIAHADILILPSYDEGLPLVILEAMANGVAVICTPVGEIPNFLTNKKNACFVKPGDVNGIANAIREILENKAVREMYEVNSKLLFNEMFSVNKFSGRIAEIHKCHFGVSAIHES